jgi:hypothetical protein
LNYDREKYKEMLFDAAETILGIFGFDRTFYGKPKEKMWWMELNGAIILPFISGNVKLNYEQTTPTFLNTDYYDTSNNRTSYFIPAEGKNQ